MIENVNQRGIESNVRFVPITKLCAQIKMTISSKLSKYQLFGNSFNNSFFDYSQFRNGNEMTRCANNGPTWRYMNFKWSFHFSVVRRRKIRFFMFLNFPNISYGIFFVNRHRRFRGVYASNPKQEEEFKK